MKKVEFSYQYTKEEKALIEKRSRELANNKQVQVFLEENKLSEEFLRANLSKFNSWTRELDECRSCSTLAACVKVNSGRYLDIRYEEGIIIILERPCKYFLKKAEEESFLRNYLVRDFPDQLTDVSLTRIQGSEESAEYRDLVIKLSDWLLSDSKQGYYMYGDVGVGKTYLAACIANDFSRRNKKIAFVHVPTFAARIRSLLDDMIAYDKEIHRLKTADLLILDDIGAENGSAWFRDEVLLPILNYRMENEGVTWFSSNLSLAQLEVHYKYMRNRNGSPEELNAIRIMERIRALSTEIKLEGHNRRRN